jgi:acetyl-CoA carboxylase biotin carboxyl carrier protein
MADKKSNGDEKLPIAQINKLAEILKSQDLTEIEVEHESFGKIKVRREAAVVHAAISSAPVHHGGGKASAAAKPDDIYEVTSPMVGTFYQSSSPGTDAFVKVGDKVKKGDTLCIVEAMKLMNELPSEIAGEIVEICIADGQAISFGQLLMKIRKS